MFPYFQAVDSNGPDHLGKRFFSRTVISSCVSCRDKKTVKIKVNFHGLIDCEKGTLTRHTLFLHDDLRIFSKNLKVINSHKQKMS